MSTHFTLTTAAPLSSGFTSSMAPACKRMTLALTCAAALVLGGCAATGAPFTAPAVVPDGQAQLYLYRKSALQASGITFTVQVNKKDVGELFNASYMQLPLSPGEHVLSVKPSAMSKTYEHSFKIESNQTQYVEFELPHFLLANMFSLGSDITPREAEKAKADMQGLKGVK